MPGTFIFAPTLPEFQYCVCPRTIGWPWISRCQNRFGSKICHNTRQGLLTLPPMVFDGDLLAPALTYLPLARLCDSWITSSSPLFTLLCSVIPILDISSGNSQTKTPSQRQTAIESLIQPGQSRSLYASQACANISTASSLPTASRFFPSVLSPLSSLTLHSTSRLVAANRQPNTIYRAALCNKLRRPEISPPFNLQVSSVLLPTMACAKLLALSILLSLPPSAQLT
jgi:hypothetical protein